jgi:hypothetical protein
MSTTILRRPGMTATKALHIDIRLETSSPAAC